LLFNETSTARLQQRDFNVETPPSHDIPAALVSPESTSSNRHQSNRPRYSRRKNNTRRNELTNKT
jgi:hypothetical protein